ncbi:hypothetical protein B296_00016169 [Ensete ventricosum]|uniref:Uncharacterized protein n=1 Tax=Ensete ventricosum TaxID=4639 RepID=A0A426ZJW9_ENSVE|nr:hypothetical protein B296_00016169 [Ensete ventricosum]
MVRSPPPLFLPLAALPSSSAAGLRPPIDELEHSGSSWNASSKREERRGGNRSSSVTQKQFSLKSSIAIIRGKTGSLRSRNCTPFVDESPRPQPKGNCTYEALHAVLKLINHTDIGLRTVHSHKNNVRSSCGSLKTANAIILEVDS